ncbi:MAG: methyl-accepting chemotaxis protein [Pseudomonadota bacterium]
MSVFQNIASLFSRKRSEDAELLQRALHDCRAQISAIHRSQAVIEFDPRGEILSANDNFLECMGYSVDEIIGKHHRMFVSQSYAGTAEYQAFWAALARGDFHAGEYKRLGKGGKEIWINATYNPIRNEDGQVVKVVKFATDVTAQKHRNADFRGQLDAIHRSQAVIEFTTDGTIVDANDNFLTTLGYSKAEVVGQHHRIFVPAQIAQSDDYKQFWGRLRAGQYEAGEFERLSKAGEPVWIQAAYNPILDDDGKVLKVVKVASDITDQKRLQLSIEECMAETASVMAAVSEGDLSQRIHGSYEGQFAILKDSVNQTLENLSTTIASMDTVARGVDDGSSNILRGNRELQQRTEEQAASLERTAEAMEEITSTVRQNADNAARANELAQQAQNNAESGGTVAEQAMNAMEAINESSKKIADIIRVIDEIAFQTNLLALNASVEAARAGEQGRGFAVVASEVRNLAGRSATAAKEIKDLIEDSGTKVDDGSRLVNESGEALAEIVAGVKLVTDIVSEISTASREQSIGIDSINQAMTQMDSVNQQNARLVGKVSQSSESLSDQAENLQELVASFSVTGASQGLSLAGTAAANQRLAG